MFDERIPGSDGYDGGGRFGHAHHNFISFYTECGEEFCVAVPNRLISVMQFWTRPDMIYHWNYHRNHKECAHGQ
jgi:hypothetical protein